MRTLLVSLALLSLAGCTDEGSSRRALADAGFTSIQVGGYAVFMCGKDDNFATKFIAVNPAGRRVEGAVCCGFLKGCTVRF